MPERLFTAAEADALLPEIRVLLERLRPQPKGAGRRAPNVIVGNGSAAGAAEPSVMKRLHAEALRRLLDMGVVVRDLSAGLIDFPALRSGEPIFLCWRLGEPRVAFWHDRTSGFSGRSPL